jgi:hypothetical protein
VVEQLQTATVERVQLGVRMEKSMVKVLKGLAEFNGVSLGQLLEKIVLHSFEPFEGEEGEWAASPHGKKALAAIADLKRIYGMDYDMHALRSELASGAAGNTQALTFPALKGMATGELLALRASTPRNDVRAHYAIRRALRAGGYYISKSGKGKSPSS